MTKNAHIAINVEGFSQGTNSIRISTVKSIIYLFCSISHYYTGQYSQKDQITTGA